VSPAEIAKDLARQAMHDRHGQPKRFTEAELTGLLEIAAEMAWESAITKPAARRPSDVTDRMRCPPVYVSRDDLMRLSAEEIYQHCSRADGIETGE
jgi:hypothetical protein